MGLKPIKIIKILIRLTAIIGVVITFCNLKGCFLDENRQSVYNQLLQKSSEYSVPISNRGAKIFLDNFYFSKQLPADMRQSEIKGLILKWIAFGNNPPMSGTVHVEFTNGKGQLLFVALMN